LPRLWSSRAAILFAAFALIGGTAVALADDGSGSASSDFVPPRAEPPVTDAMREQLAKTRAEHAAYKERRDTPEEREERVRSRVAYRGLGRDEALAIAERELPEVFGHPWFNPITLPEGARVKRFVGDDGALLEGGETPRLIESMGMPLTSTVGSGERQVVDLRLRRTEAGFEPENPVAPLRITTEGAAVLPGSGTEIRLDGIEAAGGPVERDGRVFFANALSDTDLVLAPAPAGVSFSFQVRSADAPEEALLSVELPVGRQLRVRSDDRGDRVDIVDQGGDVTARVLPPSAWDADGEPVAVRYELDGQRIVVRFPHRERDLRYPLYVDPIYENYAPWYGDGSWSEWGWYANGNVWPHGAVTGQRMWIENQYNPAVYYYQDEFGSWSWHNTRGYIASLEGYGVTHNATQITCAYMGILSSTWGYWKSAWGECPGYPYTGGTVSGAPKVTNADKNPGDWAMFQFKMAVSGVRFSGAGKLETYGAIIGLEDDDIPTLGQTTDVPNSTNGNWVGPNTTVTVYPRAIDRGLGMRAFNLYDAGTSTSWAPFSWVRPDGSATSDANQACSGLRGSRCPNDREVTGAVTFNTTDLSASGARTIAGGAFDALGKQGTYSTVVRYDNTPPQAMLGGELWRLRGPASLMPGNYQLEITPDDVQSGVASVQGFVNTGSGWQAAGFADQWLDGSQKYVWTFKGGAYASPSTNREVQIRMAVADRVGNVHWVPDFSVVLYPSKPEKLGLPEERLYAYGVGDHQPAWHVDPSTSATTSWDPRMLEDIQANQLGFVRVAFNADHSNFNTPGANWNFTAYDTIVTEAARKGLQVLPILINQVPNPLSPADLLSKPPQSATERENFATWAGAVARRYGPRYDPANRGTFWADPANGGLPYRPILAWEIWNEPNSTQDHLKFANAAGASDPAGYADLLARVENAFRGSTSLAQPNARIVFGGLTVSDRVAVPYLTFLESVITNGGKGHFDAVGVHPYAKDDIEALQLIKDLRTRLNDKKYKLNTVQIWPSEIAWSVGDPDPRFNAANEETQAMYLEMLLYALEAQRGTLNLGPIGWFPLHDFEPRRFWGHRAGLKDFSGNESTGVSNYPPAPTPSYPVRWNGPNRLAFNKLRLYAYLEDAIPLPAMH
jgi:hypothetical protein